MEFYFIILIALALALDAFSVSVAAGSYFGLATKRQKFRLSFHFGLFQFLMPILGWAAGLELVKFMKDYDHWIALFLLAAIGSKMIYDGFSKNDDLVKKDISRGLSLIMLSVATSIDALAVGLSIGILKQNIFFPALVIGITASAMSLLGIRIGEYLSKKIAGKASIIGGIILIAIGIKIVIEHLELF